MLCPGQGQEASEGELGTLSGVGSWMMMSGVVDGLSSPMPKGSELTQGNLSVINSRRIPHQVCGVDGAWRKQGVEPHSMVQLDLSLSVSGYEANGCLLYTSPSPRD